MKSLIQSLSKHVVVVGAMMFAAALNSACVKQSNDELQPLNQSSIAAPPETMTIVIHGYRPQAGMALQNLFVSNLSVKVSQGQLQLSSARDGMWDALKQSLNPTYGFLIGSPESVVNGYSDLVLYDLGATTAQQPLFHCANNQTLSSSNDALIYNDDRLAGSPMTFLGLRDCEKQQLGLNPLMFDFVGNGIPDPIKLQCGLNPLDKSEAYISTSGDGVANIDKCKQHIPINESASTQANQLFAYHYTTQDNADGSIDFTISNIAILNGGDENFISFYVTETGLNGTSTAVYTAFAVMKSGYAGKTLNMDYWATSQPTFYNQQIAVP
jgi:hypothetical protein